MSQGGIISLSGSGAVSSVTTTNATPQFVKTGTNENIDFNITNLALGSSMPANNTGFSNIGLGPAVLGTNTAGVGNVGIGYLSLQKITSGNENIAIGYQSCGNLTTAVSNVILGAETAENLNTGSFNTIIGYSAFNSFISGAANEGHNIAIGATALDSLLTGVYNISIGVNSSFNYGTSESSNIVIGNSGTAAESNTIRIGTTGSSQQQQNKTFIGGIKGVLNTNNTLVTQNSSTEQLGATVTTYPNVNPINTLLYASAANIMSTISSVNNGVFTTSNTGVPSWLSSPSATGRILQSNNGAPVSFSTATYPSTSGTSGNVLTSDGTNFVSTSPVYFSSYLANSSSNVTGDGTEFTVIFDTITTQVGGTNYNNSNGTFTAPANGFYQFSCSLFITGLTASHTEGLSIFKWSVRQNRFLDIGNIGAQRNGSNQYGIGSSWGIFMSANDTLTISLLISGGSKVVGILGSAGSPATTFTAIKLA